MVGSRITGSSGRNYTVISELGRGGFGVVYLVQDDQGARHALKLIAPITEPEARLSFEQEIQSTKGLSHENILSVLDHGGCSVGSQQGLFAVSPYCSDGDYRRVLASRSQPAEIEDIIVDVEQILMGLDVLHSRIVHRDLKPENILRSGNTLKIADFGLARFVDQATRTLTFKGGGTPRYMAPEVWLMQRATPATDLYAVGVILYEAVTGKVPFDATDLYALRDQHLYIPAPRAKNLRSDLPDSLDGIIKKLLAKEVRDRFQSARELLDAIHSARPPGEPVIAELAARARQRHDAEEQTRLTVRREAQEAADEAARIGYKEKELAGLVNDVVSDVNAQLVETKIMPMTSGRDRVWKFGNRLLRLHFFEPGEIYRNPEVPARMPTLEERHVAHGGYFEIQEEGHDREGWNIVLVRPPENLYGEWLIVESRLSPLTGRTTRFEPVATEARLFADNLACHWMRSIHIYILTDKRLERADIVKMLGYLIPAPR